MAKHCIDRAYDVIGRDNITEILEPSAGNGSFSNQIEECVAYDIEPECEGIVKQDYLELNIDYKKGRLVIGNPPYGNRNNLSRAFFKKSIEIADYISFILPISQLNNTNSLYQFDLVYSEDLGAQTYTGRNIHCCFNIYKKPEDGKLNKKTNHKLKDLDIYRDDYKGLIDGKGYSDMEYDLCIFRRGASAGRVKVENINKQTYKMVIHNKDYKDRIIDEILNFDWMGYKTHQSAPSISKNDIYIMLKEKIPELQ